MDLTLEPTTPVTGASHTRFGLLAYGPNVRTHREATLSALTIQLYAPPDSEIVLVTDHPTMYRWLGTSITIDRLSASTLRAWRGPFDDKFRPKLEAARQLFELRDLAREDLGHTDLRRRRRSLRGLVAGASSQGQRSYRDGGEL